MGDRTRLTGPFPFFFEISLMGNTNSCSYPARIFYVCLFAVAMGYFEAMVVVYLRELYYPEGFSFPLKLISPEMIILELFREAATIVMLSSVSALAAKKFWNRFGYFIILFGVWDIFFYIWLKVTINWPSTLFEWDILFLIPLPWIGPVIAPVLVAVLMIAVGLSITHLFHKGYNFRPTVLTWMLAIAATLLILYSFMRDIEATLHQKIPEPYYYPLLLAGLVLYGVAYIISYRKAKRTPS